MRGEHEDEEEKKETVSKKQCVEKEKAGVRKAKTKPKHNKKTQGEKFYKHKTINISKVL
jgi:hypothetical protein